MSAFGTPGIQPLPGVPRVEHFSRDRDRRKPGPAAPSPAARDGDTLDLEVHDTNADDAIRRSAGNAHEETVDDRRRQGEPDSSARPPLDLRA